MGGTNKFTLLGDLVWGFEDGMAGNEVDEADRRWQLAGPRHPGGASRCLFGVGGGPTEAIAEAKQDVWNGSTQAGVRNKMRNNDLRLCYGHASVALRSAS